MTIPSDIPEEQWTPKLLRAHYQHPSQLRAESELRVQVGDTRFAAALNAEATRWEIEIQLSTAPPAQPTRALTSPEVAKILAGNLATLIECSDAETVLAALAWFLHDEEYWKPRS